VIQPGELLDGYRTIRLIGSGGFGAVWLCRSEAVGDLRALKFIPILDEDRHDREFEALTRYRQSANQLRSPAILLIEHVNRREDGLFYIMPLCDGYGAADPIHPDWRPTTLTAVLEGCRSAEAWLSVEQVRAYMTPVLEALQLLSDAGLVHRDVKPDNILFVNNLPCLADISLLGDDSFSITRRGTPGYSAPSWYVESGGHPDMYGAATTLYSVLTGNPPDKMGRANFRWPPQGEQSLSPEARVAWLHMHAAIRRATDDRPAERFADFNGFARALMQPGSDPTEESNSTDEAGTGKRARFRKKQRGIPRGLILASAVALVCVVIGLSLANWRTRDEAGPTSVTGTNTPPLQNGGGKTNARIEIQEFETALASAVKTMSFSREQFTAEMDAIAADLYVHDTDNAVAQDVPRKPLPEIKTRFINALKALPQKPDTAARVKVLADLRSRTNQIGDKYGGKEREKLEAKILKFESELNTDADFRKEQGMKVLKRATKLVNSHPESHDIMRAAQNFSFAGMIE
jgi:serine/threonine-protein kinase